MGFFVMVGSFIAGVLALIGAFTSKQSAALRVVIALLGLVFLGFAVWLAL